MCVYLCACEDTPSKPKYDPCCVPFNPCCVPFNPCPQQESRIGRAVEVMIQHVENLRRTYTKEHTELVELRESVNHNERSFGSHGHTDRGNHDRQLHSRVI